MGELGLQEGKAVHCIYVDKTHFEAYKTALWSQASLALTGKDGTLYCNDRRIDFPPRKNVVLVRSPEEMIFVAAGDDYFLEASGNSEIWYLLGKIPKFKGKNKGILDLHKFKADPLFRDAWAAFLRVPTAPGTRPSDSDRQPR